jgi:hypothetical protein
MGPETMIFIIPIVSLLIPIFAIYFHYKEEQQRRKERMLAIEKGVELPPEPAPKPLEPLDYLRKGLIFLAVGLGVLVGSWLAAGKIGGDVRYYFQIGGFVVAFIGVALVIFYVIQSKSQD